MRAGYLGGLAAWTGFTLPSAIVLVLFAYGAGALSGPIGAGLLHGLKLVAVAIVAQAVWGMARTLCPDRERASIAVVAALIILFSTSSVAQIGAIAARRPRRTLALPRRADRPPAGHVDYAGLAHASGLVALTCVLSSCSRGLPVLRSSADVVRGRLVRSLLPLRRAGVRRRPRRAAAAARGVCDAGLGQRRCVPCRLWRGAGGSGAALHFRRLSRRRRQLRRRTALPARPWV